MSARHPEVPGKLPANAAAHAPFSFLHKEFEFDSMAQFVALTMDITQGVQTCLEMVHTSSLARSMNLDSDAGDEDVPLLSVVDTERLLRFATASAGMLASKANDTIDWLNKYKVKGGK